MTATYADVAIDWLGYATVRIEGSDTIVYVDPGRYGVLTGDWTPIGDGSERPHPPARDYRPEDGDVVLVTHVHHYDPDGIDRVASDDATVIAFEGIDTNQTSRTSVRPADLDYAVRAIGSGAETLSDDVPVWAVDAYNNPDGPHTDPDGKPYHPEGFGCGFLLSVDGRRFFLPGDTDVLPGHEELSVDVFLPPIGGTFTMDRHAAADLAAALAPDLVVPTHYNTFEAIAADPGAFAGDVSSRAVPVARDER